MAHTFGNFEILSCPAYQTSSMIPCWLYIMLVSRRLLPFRLRLMLPSQQALSPTFQLLLLPLSADLFRLYLTSPVLATTHSMSSRICSLRFHTALASISVFGFSSFLPAILVSCPDSAREPTWFSVVLLLGRTDGGC